MAISRVWISLEVPMKPRLTAGERAMLIVLLALVASAAVWKWWKIHRLGEENLRAIPGITHSSQNLEAK
jgi:hypothetical protein